MNDSNPLSTIAHKLRTPLTVIVSTVNNLLDGAFGKLNDDQRAWLKKLNAHTAHLEELLNKILGLLKGDVKKAEMVKNTLDQPDMAPPQPKRKIKATPALGDEVPEILIVDDEPDILDVIQEGLSTKGYKILTADNGDEALRLALEKKPDVILMDVLLQHQNGMEICRKIKEKTSSYTPVILVTGQDDLREKVSGAQHEADDLLSKPFQMEELFMRVTSMLRLKKLYNRLEHEGAEIE